MRIISGTLGGRNFQSPRGHRTHPMSDKIRGALFNMLGDLGGLTVLDAFSGSGALGLESVSRGATNVLSIDSDRAAHDTILQNIRDLGIGRQMRAIRQNISSWSVAHPTDTFDVVLADPPYDDIKPAVIAAVARHVKPNGVYVLSWPGNMTPPELEGLNRLSTKSYGDAQLIVYRSEFADEAV